MKLKGEGIGILRALTEKNFPPDDLHADEVGDLDVVLGPDAGDGGGEEHGCPGESDKESAGDEELEAEKRELEVLLVAPRIFSTTDNHL